MPQNLPTKTEIPLLLKLKISPPVQEGLVLLCLLFLHGEKNTFLVMNV